MNEIFYPNQMLIFDSIIEFASQSNLFWNDIKVERLKRKKVFDLFVKKNV